MIPALIVCEGYTDRDFLGKWLLACGWHPLAGPAAKRPERIERLDPGVHAYRGPNGCVAWLKPARGLPGILGAARDYLLGLPTKPVCAVVLVSDGDDLAGREDAAPSTARTAGWIRSLRGDGSLPPEARALPMLGLSLGDDGQHRSGLPPKQTLERLVCAAILAAHPERARSVEEFLASKPPGPTPSEKSYFWSYAAKWYPEATEEGAIAEVWKDAAVRAELLARMNRLGGADILGALDPKPTDHPPG